MHGIRGLMAITDKYRQEDVAKVWGMGVGGMRAHGAKGLATVATCMLPPQHATTPLPRPAPPPTPHPLVFASALPRSCTC